MHRTASQRAEMLSALCKVAGMLVRQRQYVRAHMHTDCVLSCQLLRHWAA